MKTFGDIEMVGMLAVTLTFIAVVFIICRHYYPEAISLVMKV